MQKTDKILSASVIASVSETIQTDLDCFANARNDNTNSKLKSLQQALQKYLVHGDKTIQQHLTQKNKITIADGLAVYREGYQSRLLETLAEDYPTVKTLLGDEELFITMALGYMTQHPSQHSTIRWIGRDLSLYLKNTTALRDSANGDNKISARPEVDAKHPSKKEDGHPGNATPHAPISVLSDMAAFEWALTEAFDATDVPTIDIAQIAAMPDDEWSSLTFSLHPSVKILNFNWDVIALWQAVNTNPTQPITNIQTYQQATTCLIWRKELDPHFRSLDEAEASALLALSTKPSLAALYDSYHHAKNQNSVSITNHPLSFLQEWLEMGLLTI